MPRTPTAAGYLLFSDPNANTIYRWSPDGQVSVFRTKSGYAGIDVGEYGQPGSNGLTLDRDGRLTIDEHEVVEFLRDTLGWCGRVRAQLVVYFAPAEAVEAQRRGEQLVARARDRAQDALLEPLPESLHERLREALSRIGVEALYAHQADALQSALEGHTIVTTGTASGKSLAFNLPVLDTLARDPAARALYLEYFPFLFAIPRASGWLAQWLELTQDKEQKIARPRQVYLGPAQRDYVPVERRG